MRRSSSFLILAIVLLSMVFSSNARAQRIKANSSIDEVTVFLQGAQVTRSARVGLSAGKNEVLFEGLSTRIDKNSIQVKGNDSYTILSVDAENQEFKEEEFEGRIKSKKDSLEDIEFKLDLRKNLKKVYEEERSLILTNKNIKGNQTGVNVEDLMELAVYYRKRLKEIQYKLIELNNDIEELSKERAQLDQKIRELRIKARKTRGSITVRLKTSSSRRVDIQLQYLVGNAGWQPAYDIRCSSIEDPIDLIYKGRVWQKTGTDWEDVDLTLSTSQPVKSGTQPKMNPWYLSFYQPRQVSYRKSKGQYQQQQGAKKEAYTQDLVGGISEADDREQPLHEQVNAQQTSINTTFTIETPYTIPSDGRKHSADIRRYDLPADYEYFAIPKLDKDAFLLAKVTGWEKYSLLPGTAGIYFKGTYVGKSALDPNITNDTLSLSLGRDNALVVERDKVKDKTRSTIIGSNKKVTISIELKVKNTKSQKIRMQLKDQIPLSKRGDVEVELLEKGGAEHSKQSGYLSWDLELGSGESKTLEFTYMVKFPKELNPNNL